jgi:hypothetical protein
LQFSNSAVVVAATAFPATSKKSFVVSLQRTLAVV